MKGVELRDLAVVVDNMLVISDVHMGYEEALNKEGFLIPRHQFRLTKNRLQKVLDRDYDSIIFNGDIKHEFGTISDTEWRHTLKLIDIALKHTKRVIIVKGNHDKTIGPIASKRNVEVLDEFKHDDLLVTHGDHIPDLEGVERIIIGHEHPAIALKDYPRVEKFKCFLEGKYNGIDLIVMPSFNLVQTGTDVLSGKLLSPFLKDIDDFRIIISMGGIKDFGTVASLRLFDKDR